MKTKLLIISLFSIFFSFSAKSQRKSLSSLDSLIYKKKEYNLNVKNGFRIQLYNGSEEVALKKITEFKKLFTDIEIYRTYKVPEWKVQTEVFKTRLEADRILNRIKKEYPGARVL
jgi:hypothetical protein